MSLGLHIGRALSESGEFAWRRTQTLLARQRRHHTGREVLHKVIVEKDKVLEASPRVEGARRVLRKVGLSGLDGVM